MAAQRTLVVNIIGDSASAQRAFAKTATAANSAATGMEAAGAKMSSVGSTMASVGKKWTTHVSLPLAAVGIAATKMSLDYQKSMLLIQTHTDTTTKQVEQYKKAILSMSASGQFTQGPKDLADAMYHVASDGYKGAKALGVLRESAHLATVGQSDLADTTYALVSALKTGIRGTENMHKAIGTLNGIVGAGDMKMQDLVGAMSTGVIPVAKLAGASLTDVGAALDVLTQRGIPAQKAAYGLSMNFGQLVPFTDKAKGAFDSMGLSYTALGKQIHGPTGLLDALSLLQDHLDKFSRFQQGTLVREIFGGGRTSRGMLTLLENLDGLKKSYESINRLQGETDKNLKTALASPANVWAKQWAALQASLVGLGNVLVPVVIPALKTITGDVTAIAAGFSGLPPIAQHWAIGLGVAAIAMGPLLTVGGNVLKVFGSITKQIKAAGVALGVFEATSATASSGYLATPAAGLKSVVAKNTGEDSVYALARSFGRGRSASAMAQFGASAESMAGTLAGGLAKAIPYAVAAAGIGNVLSSAISGNTKDAAFKAGGAVAGAVAGGIAGSFVGNPAMGAMLGSGIGSMLGGLFENLFTSEKKLKPLQVLLNEEAQHAAEALHKQRDAANSLAAAQDRLIASNHRHRAASEAVRKAQQDLNQATRQFGPNSDQATAAELRLANAQRKDAQTAKQARDAHHLAGDALSLYKHQTVEAVASDKQRIPLLQQQITALRRQHNEHKGNYDILAKLVNRENALSKVQGNLNQLYADAQSKVGPRFVASLKAMTDAQSVYGTHMQGLIKQLPQFGQATKQWLGIGGGQWIDYRGTVHTSTQRATQDMLSMTGTTKRGMLQIQGWVQNALNSMGVSSQSFQLTGGGGGNKKGHARGGTVRVGGAGLEDTVPLFGADIKAMVAPGEDLFVANRHQRPLLDEAVSGWFGVGGLDGFFSTFNRPHYMAQGGKLTEPQIAGPSGPLRSIGQGGIDRVYKAAAAFLEAHKGKGGAGGTGSLPGTGASVPGHPELKPGVSRIVNDILKHFPGLTITSTTGGGHAADSYHYSGRAADLAASGPYMLKAAGWIGSNLGRSLTEGIHDPNLSIKDGHGVPASFWGPAVWQEHLNHIHVAYAKGGILPRFSGGGKVSGKVSTFGPPGEGAGTTASGASSSHPGIAIYDRSTLGDWFWVTIGSHSGMLRQTDIGPAPWTGRKIDVTGAGAQKLGINPSSFPTDSFGTAVDLGSNLSAAQKSAHSGSGAAHHVKLVSGLGKAHAVVFPGLKASPLPSAATGLPSAFKGLLTQPGLTFAERLEIAGQAVDAAGNTAGTADDTAALNYRIALEQGNRKRLKKRLAQLDADLKKRQSTAQRKKTLGERAAVLSALGTTEGDIASDKGTLAGLGADSGGSSSNSDLVQAIKDLQASIDQQNHFANQVTSVSLGQAWKALADLISGQIAGNLNPIGGAPTVGVNGVARY